MIHHFAKAVYICILSFVMTTAALGQADRPVIDLPFHIGFLEELTRVVMDSSRILPGQVVASGFGVNRTGGTLIRPGGRSSYPSFWIRDYAMSLPSGFVTLEEQRHMLLLTASTQSNRSWKTAKGAMVPMGSIADHIRPDDGVPIYFPGTYDPAQQGDPAFGTLPPFCDQFFFVDMAYWYLKSGGSAKILDTMIQGRSVLDRLELAFSLPPTRADSALVHATEADRGVDFGFRDVIAMTGDLLYPSLLKYHAALEMAELWRLKGRTEKVKFYSDIASVLKKEIPTTFADGSGMLRASTGKSRQRDVWGTTLAVYFGVLEGDEAKAAGRYLLKEWKPETQFFRHGGVRHVVPSDDFDSTTSWESSLAKKGDYQNGGYWGTPVGWVAVTVALVDLPSANGLIDAFVVDLQDQDFRKGPAYGAPWECYNKNEPQNPVYLTTVACPYIALKGLGRKVEPLKKE